MLKIAHFVQVAPNRSGLYETTREIAWGQREFINWDARMIDVTGIVSGTGVPIQSGEDRGVPIADLDWAAKADVHFLHSGIPGAIEGTKPVFYFAHGLPEYVFYSQMLCEVHTSPVIREQRSKNTPFHGPWSLISTLGKMDWMKGAITLWKRHKPYLEPYFNTVIQSNHFCKLDAFIPQGDGIKYMKPAGEEGFNISFADHWRYNAFKDPFQLLHGARKFCLETGSKIHLYALPKDEIEDLRHPWNSILHSIGGTKDNDVFPHVIGDLHTVHGDIASVHRTADLLVTPSCDDTRTILEAAACGCPVLAREGTEGALFHCRMEDPEDVDRTLWRIYNAITKEGKELEFRKKSRALAEKFQLEDAVRKIEEGMMQVL